MSRVYSHASSQSQQGKHESIRHLIFANVADLSQSLPIEYNDYLFEHIRALPVEAMDEQYVQLLKQVAIYAHGVVESVCVTACMHR